MPRFDERCEDEAPPRPEGLEATAGAREPDDEEGPPRVAMQVGMTNEGSELPAKLGGNALSASRRGLGVRHRLRSARLTPSLCNLCHYRVRRVRGVTLLRRLRGVGGRVVCRGGGGQRGRDQHGEG